MTIKKYNSPVHDNSKPVTLNIKVAKRKYDPEPICIPVIDLREAHDPEPICIPIIYLDDEKQFIVIPCKTEYSNVSDIIVKGSQRCGPLMLKEM